MGAADKKHSCPKNKDNGKETAKDKYRCTVNTTRQVEADVLPQTVFLSFVEDVCTASNSGYALVILR